MATRLAHGAIPVLTPGAPQPPVAPPKATISRGG